jgi:hypothetical protein
MQLRSDLRPTTLGQRIAQESNQFCIKSSDASAFVGPKCRKNKWTKGFDSHSHVDFTPPTDGIQLICRNRMD